MVDGIAVYAKLVLVKTRQHELRELLPVPEPLRLHGLELALEGVLLDGRGEGGAFSSTWIPCIHIQHILPLSYGMGTMPMPVRYVFIRNTTVGSFH